MVDEWKQNVNLICLVHYMMLFGPWKPFLSEIFWPDPKPLKFSVCNLIFVKNQILL